MKVIGVIAKVLTALAAVAGAVYVFATYGDRIVAWAKKLLGLLPKCEEPSECVDEPVEEVPAAEDAEAPAEEPAEEPVSEEPTEEVVADEADFEG